MAKNEIACGQIRTTAELGGLVRAYRKNKGLTLEAVSGLGNLSTRFLSEFERGKETAEIGKILKALKTLGLEISLQPRGPQAPSLRSPPATKTGTEKS